MRNLLLLVFLLLTACQNTNTPDASGKKQTWNKNKTSQKSALYDRYKYKQNRYTMEQDKAPDKNKKVSFKEPVPTKEPLSRYGNPANYRVDGRNYEILKNSRGYKRRGVASWYGSKFHKQRTSSGEPYNMYVMTAAHKTLPLPTYVRVTNLDNGRVAVVKVNDRGPFHSNRIIDLSYAAAVKLGVFPKGTANVEVEAIMGPSTQGRYYLQAGAFVTERSAKDLKSKIARITSSPVTIERFRQHYIVKVGPFGNKNQSDNLKSRLARNGISGSFSVLV